MYPAIRITDILPAGPDAKTFVFEMVDGSDVQYKPGQFITLIFPAYGSEERRSYSLSTAPGTDARPAFTVKRIPNGTYSRLLIDRTKTGDQFMISGISGFFTLPADMQHYEQFVFLAAGSGITPVYSLLKSLLHRYPDKKIVLLYSNRSEADTIFYRELNQLQQQYSERLKIEFLFSTAQNLARARLNTELLNLLLKHYVQHDYSRVQFYLCGPYDYMMMGTITLKTAGVPEENIRKEQFSIIKRTAVRRPSDTDVHEVEVRINSKVFHFPVQYPVTILQEAKKRGIGLPYSCESGSCGACSATCTSGRVWMWNNEVLTDAEMATGRVLTCTGYPVGGDVVLEY